MLAIPNNNVSRSIKRTFSKRVNFSLNIYVMVTVFPIKPRTPEKISGRFIIS